MKNNLFLIICWLAACSSLSAQKLIAVQNGGTPSFFTTLEDAYNNAQNGDTIYLPGGLFSSIQINKKIHIVGVGHDPDSTSATTRTIINGNLQIFEGAQNGSVNGIDFTSDGFIYFNSVIDGYTISRCYLSGGIQINNINQLSNIIIEGNIISSNVNLGTASHNNIINNNLIASNYVRASASVIKNNIFTYFGDYQYFIYTENNIIENNIFIQPFSPNNNNHNNVFRNNVNCSLNGIDAYNNQGIGNFDGVFFNNLFVNPGSYSDYTADWRLVPGSTYHNAGSDGTDIGIYGGLFPWKEGSVPFNPHVQFKQISGTTEPNGNLNVNIRVKAQDH